MHKLAIAALLTVGVLFSNAVQAQWAWKDAKGSMVFSDSPPPPDIPASAIVKRPGEFSTPASGAGASIGTEDTATGQKSAAQMEAEFRKRRADRAKAEQEAADKAAKEQSRIEQCARARNSLKMLEEGHRMRSSTSGGAMEDDERAAAATRLRKDVANLCG